MADSKEVVISTEALNGEGTRVMTAGIDISQYQRNPVLLYMHQRFGDSMPIGRMENLRFEGNRLLGTPVFDMDDPFAAKVANKWNKDFLRMVSPWFEILETNATPEVLLPGQTRATVTRCKLVECSIVDIAGNDDALRLAYDGKELKLAGGAASDVLPLLKSEKDPTEGADNNLETKPNEMKDILLALGLAETATSAQAVTAIGVLTERANAGDSLKLAAITGVVDAAVEAKRITADQREHFIGVGQAMGVEGLNKTLALMKPAMKPTDFTGRAEGADPGAGGEGTLKLAWKDLTPETADKLKREDPQRYIALYKEQYGYAPRLEA